MWRPRLQIVELKEEVDDTSKALDALPHGLPDQVSALDMTVDGTGGKGNAAPSLGSVKACTGHAEPASS